jgi:hypothetical protein
LWFKSTIRPQTEISRFVDERFQRLHIHDAKFFRRRNSPSLLFLTMKRPSPNAALLALRGVHAALGLLALAPLTLPSPARAQTTVAPKTSHTFVFRAESKVQSVTWPELSTGWNKDANPMRVDEDGLTWRLALPLEFGLHQYKFVINGETWTPDPQRAQRGRRWRQYQFDFVSGTARLRASCASKRRPNRRQRVLHEQRAPWLNFDRGQLSLSLRVRPGDVSAVRLRSANRRIPMTLVNQNELYATYRGVLPWNRRENLRYSFELQDGQTVREFGARGLNSAPFAIVAKDFKPFEVPEWVEKTFFIRFFPTVSPMATAPTTPKTSRSGTPNPNGSIVSAAMSLACASICRI